MTCSGTGEVLFARRRITGSNKKCEISRPDDDYQLLKDDPTLLE
jgi:hypothetical protein